MRNAPEIAALMAASAFSPAEQIRQTQFRMDLAREWDIQPGMRILEIGCGQGDMTAVLADLVGIDGCVVALDNANRDYGAPVSLGDSTDLLSNGPLGTQIQFHLGFDERSPLPTHFDAVVFAHCSWYFSSLEALAEILRSVGACAPTLFFSEWDLEPNSSDQLGHLMAVVIQGQIQAFDSDSSANVRTPYSRQTMNRILAECGWVIRSEMRLVSPDVADGRWEIDACLAQLAPGGLLSLPPKLRQFVYGQGQVLESLRSQIKSLPAFSLVADRI